MRPQQSWKASSSVNRCAALTHSSNTVPIFMPRSSRIQTYCLMHVSSWFEWSHFYMLLETNQQYHDCHQPHRRSQQIRRWHNSDTSYWPGSSTSENQKPHYQSQMRQKRHCCWIRLMVTWRLCHDRQGEPTTTMILVLGTPFCLSTAMQVIGGHNVSSSSSFGTIFSFQLAKTIKICLLFRALIWWGA